MANRETGGVDFTANGKTYTLRFSTNALCELEDATGKGAIAVAEEMNSPNNVRIKTLRAMFWAGLTDCHEGITIRDAGDIMGEIGVDKAGPLIGEAFQAAFPDAEAGETEKGKPKAA